ncbi:hypothetical protein BCAR13_540043 [Paraburkholderia caribensis]|nr:hypothetical protein BCAR13_540043 [Paraburkholderia caribensis]
MIIVRIRVVFSEYDKLRTAWSPGESGHNFEYGVFWLGPRDNQTVNCIVKFQGLQG